MDCPGDNTLAAFARGKLDTGEAHDVEKHVDGCPICTELLGALGKVLVNDDADTQAVTVPHSQEAGLSFLARGARVGRFVVEGLLGSGGMGVVYRASDPELDRAVALKLLRPELSTADARARLLREAQAMARLSHPNVAVVYEVGTFHQHTFVAMELVEGETLREWLVAEKRPWAAVLDMFLQAGRGLAAAHAAGIIHRDFKPANVLVGKDGRARVVDFGLARAGSDTSVDTPSPSSLSDEITQSGAMVGTPAYMAPEQRNGERATEASDQFAFCVSLAEGLCSERPQRDAYGNMTAPWPADVPAWLRRAVQRGLSSLPELRYPAMPALLALLARDPARRRRWLIAAGAVLAATGAAGALLVTARAQNPCGGEAARLAGVWDATRRDAVHRAFAVTGLALAEPAFSAVARAFDDYAAAWTSKRKDACEATWVRREQSERALDLRTACLDQRLRDLGAVVDLMSRADDKSVRGAHEVARALPPLRECDDVAVDSALPPDPAVRDSVQAATTQHTIAQALERLGRTTEALALYRQVIDEARRLAYPTLEARALESLGTLQGIRGEHAAAKEALLAAAASAEKARDDTTKGKLWGQLAFLMGEAGQFDEAHQYCRWAEASFNRSEGGRRTLSMERANLFHTEGLIFRREGKLQDAERLLGRALEVFERTREKGPDYAAFLMNYGVLLSDLHRYDDADKMYQRALAMLVDTTSDAHPTVAMLWSNIAGVREERGDTAGAIEAARRSVDLRERYLPADALPLGISYYNLAEALVAHGDRTGVRGYLERAVAIFRQRQGDKSVYLAYAYTLLGDIHTEEGRPGDAVDVLERALAMREGTKAPPDELGYTQLALGRALWRARKDPRARQLVTAATKNLEGSKDKRVRALLDTTIQELQR